MKFYIITFCSLILLFSSCKKSHLFNGDTNLNGYILFENKITNTTDTVKEATIEITDKEKETYKVVTSNGEYKINYLNGNNDNKLELAITYVQYYKGVPLVYENKETIAVGKKSEKHADIILNWNGKGTHIVFDVKDSLSNPLDSAQVCLYANPVFMQANGNTCNGSSYTGITDKDGKLFIAGIIPGRYFFRAKAKVGNVTLTNHSNMSVDSTGYVQQNNITSVSLKLYQQ